jgi:L-asparaginase/Glu-tRNA(Gln) amidotransferase subunit D
MKSIATKVVACLQETNPSADVDLAFDPDVNICYLDPLKGLKHLQSETREASAVVLAGYGGGNILLNDGHGMGFLPLVTDLTRQQKPVVLSSQVPLGVADFVYENGVKAIEAGAIPGVDLSLPECQIRMSYLLGHRSEIERASADSGVAYMKILEVLFVSGMKFRNAQSRSLYEKAKRLPVIEEDLLTSYSREEALRQILERLRHTS